MKKNAPKFRTSSPAISPPTIDRPLRNTSANWRLVNREATNLNVESDSDKNKVSYKFEGEKLHVRIIRREDNSVKEEFLFDRSK